MSGLSPSAIRNVVLVGHAGSGKTSLVDALLAAAGVLASPGSIEKGNTVCDHDPLERELGHSLQTALVTFDWRDARLYLADTPGLPDFAGQAIAALAAADTALVVIDARTGVQATTERLMQTAGARGMCRMIVVNGIDADRTDLAGLLRDIRQRFGSECMLLDLPAGHGREVIELLSHEDGDADLDSVAGAHRALIDKLVEEDETLLARYLDDGTDPSEEELHAPFERALREGRLIPVAFTSARTGAGVAELLRIVAGLAPSPLEGNPPRFYRGDPGTPDAEAFDARPDPDRHVIAHVFKVSIDPYMGKLGMFRVFQGTVRKDMQLFVGDGRRPLRVAHLYRVHGKDLVETSSLLPGEIGAIARSEELHFDAVLHDSREEDHIHLQATVLPTAMHGLALSPKRQGDEQKLSEALARLAAEDPSLTLERDSQSHEWVIRGVGELHLQSKIDRLARAYRLEVQTRPPRVPYRETVQATAEGHHRHKKQSGGAGQFGEVSLRVEPLERGAGFEFVDQVKGGAIPGVFIPAVEKGVRQALSDGVIAGYPVVDVRVVVHDGKTHPVDGKEVAFVTAGRKAAIEAIRQASPAVLEPIVAVEVEAPEAAIGEVTGDISSRRGHVTGTATRADGFAVVSGLVPLAELAEYASRLRAMTGGAGRYSHAFSHYAPAPPGLQRRLIEAHRTSPEDD
ncbi:MAG TPA: elongation factor G [Quisquiliibacterium sp.]|nr:elongation factor G [Quisquiliibacterium sp.]